MSKNLIKILIVLLLLFTPSFSVVASYYKKNSMTQNVNAPAPFSFPNELLCKVYGGIGHFHAEIYSPVDWNNVYWTITLENIKGIIFTQHFASGFIQHISAGQYATVTIPVFGLSPGLNIHVNVTTDQGSAERTPNPEFSVFLCFAFGFDMPH